MKLRAKAVLDQDKHPYGHRFACPGCGEEHVIPTKPSPNGWDFNGDLARPTFFPSILVYENRTSPRCHSFVKDGQIQFLSDCGHSLAGQTVDLPEIE